MAPALPGPLSSRWAAWCSPPTSTLPSWKWVQTAPPRAVNSVREEDLELTMEAERGTPRMFKEQSGAAASSSVRGMMKSPGGSHSSDRKAGAARLCRPAGCPLWPPQGWGFDAITTSVLYIP